MSEYNVNTKQFDPSMFKSAISKGKYTPSQAEKEFFEWIEKNAQAGRTYVSPEGHRVHGDDIIRSREFTKSITKKINLKIEFLILNKILYFILFFIYFYLKYYISPFLIYNVH